MTVRTIDIKQLSTSDVDFDARLEQLLAWENVSDQNVEQVVNDVLADIRCRGDQALVDYTNRFDRRQVGTVSELAVSQQELKSALDTIGDAERQSLMLAAERIRHYHQHQKQESWSYREADGTLLGQQVTPLDRVGIYVPGGKACYPSSVLMNALPAKVAGVSEIIMVVPAPGGGHCGCRSGVYLGWRAGNWCVGLWYRNYSSGG